MGIISGVTSLLGVAGNVSSTVMSMGASALSFGGKFVKSLPGKLLIGGAIGSVFLSALTGGKSKGLFGSLVEKVSGGFKNFIGAAKESVTTAALKTAVTVDNAGEQLSASRDSLQNMISTDAERGTPAAAAPAAPAVSEPETTQVTYAGTEPAYGG